MRLFRALGPGSVSSLLKVALDVAYFLLWIVAAATALAAVAGVVLAPFLPSDPLGDDSLYLNGREYEELAPLLPFAVVGLVLVLGYIAGLIAIVGRLRRIFSTLTAGDPFQPENVTRLRFVGVVLAALLLLGYAMPMVMNGLFPDLTAEVEVEAAAFSLSSWFSVLVVFVLAEVFREGARLRREAELTI